MNRWTNFTKLIFKKVTHVPNVMRYSTKRTVEDSKKIVISKCTGKRESLWKLYNEVIYPPLEDKIGTIAHDGNIVPRRPAEVTNQFTNVLYSEKKLWLLGYLVSSLLFLFI